MDALVGGTDHLAQRVARDAWQAAVQHDHVVAMEGEFASRLSAVVGHVGGYALVREALGYQVCQAPAVLHDQDPHSGAPSAPVIEERGQAGSLGHEVPRAVVACWGN